MFKASHLSVQRRGAVRSVELLRWNALFAGLREPHLVQSAGYGEAQRVTEGWRVNRLVVELGGKEVAICQVLEKRLVGVCVLSRINRGPMFLEENPSADTVRAVYELLRCRWSYLRGGLLLIAPALRPDEEHHAMLTELGYRRRGVLGWMSSFILLDQDEESIRRHLKPSWRNHLRSAEKAGLQLDTSSSCEALEWIAARHSEHMEAGKFRGPSAAFLRAMHCSGPDDVVVLRAVSEGEHVGGIIVVRFGQTAEYFVGWFSGSGRELNAGNFLLWNAVLEMKKRGCRQFDLGGLLLAGGTRSDAYVHFKRGMRGTEYSLIEEWLAF